MARLSGKDREILDEALISAFRHYNALKRMVRFQLDENLEEIADKSTLNQVVFNLSNWAEAENKLRWLIEGAYKENPHNQKLQYFYKTIFPKYFPVKQSIISEKQKNALVDILE
ncbi:MAG: hypothetical protein F6K40_34330 [Okeania sp. SIO3I5]|uniref:effector-associated domain EAD1-containing protein n=1 Tax=Okeania sp. SIO3I5 TaxID=2607805 RepID=UPI0013BD79B5|nr:effector-associated domain EAD1-containing protein [Okeania sp. SIO3I5]NEQ41019.1 hypothetical protein [Okeania sp. SIO3I5]